MARTAACTNPSNSRSISRYSWPFSIATAAWPASAVTSSTVRFEKGTTCWSTSRGVAGTASKRRYVDQQVVPVARRSEEHTSELQSQSNLVCRLLLEKKKHLH